MDVKFPTLASQQPQESLAVANPNTNTDPPPQSSTAEAPPKQVALAMERLTQAARHIADVRLGRQLEESGVLNEHLRSRSNSWGLHMPLVCPDGAVVAYAWKRQLAGQAGASAVDRTRLALKAFTDQKRRFFPHLDDKLDDQNNEPASKKQCVSQVLPADNLEELNDCKTLSDVLMRLEKEVPNLKIFTYERLDWLKRASSLPSSANESPFELLKEHNFHSSNKLRPGLQNTVAADKIAVIELLFPSVFRAIVSLHPVGSIEPDAVAFFSPDEIFVVIIIVIASDTIKELLALLSCIKHFSLVWISVEVNKALMELKCESLSTMPIQALFLDELELVHESHFYLFINIRATKV
ncbi:hypothetical protein Pint_36173 [Pistacia integerrima]|uniref:Uncharacterized protein n=1 Tax=Pistacia integerrima TaxID=434235 RepID=A0ACC0XYM5_9ROSI|nr:hypothetical protein Pint_36173 [Pistacia integerrima]